MTSVDWILEVGPRRKTVFFSEFLATAIGGEDRVSCGYVAESELCGNRAFGKASMAASLCEAGAEIVVPSWVGCRRGVVAVLSELR